MKWLLLLLFSCAHPMASKHPAFVEHFVGEALVYKPNASKPIGKIQSLVRRTVDPDAHQIMEEVIQPGRGKEKAKEIVTNFVATEKIGLFNVHDQNKTFTGTVHFQGTPWSWEEWTYDIKLKDGSTLKGEGHFEKDQMHTEKKMFSKKGHLMFIIREHFKEVDAAVFKESKAKLIKSK